MSTLAWSEPSSGVSALSVMRFGIDGQVGPCAASPLTTHCEHCHEFDDCAGTRNAWLMLRLAKRLAISLLVGGFALVASFEMIFRLLTLQLERSEPHADGQAGMGPLFGAAFIALGIGMLTAAFISVAGAGRVNVSFSAQAAGLYTTHCGRRWLYPSSVMSIIQRSSRPSKK